MEKSMEKGQNFIWIGMSYKKENIQMVKEMEEEKSIIIMVKLYSKVNIKKGKNGME